MIIRHKSKKSQLNHEDVLYRNYRMLTMIELFNRDGVKIAVFDHIFPNIKDFKKWAEDHLTKKSSGPKKLAAD